MWHTEALQAIEHEIRGPMAAQREASIVLNRLLDAIYAASAPSRGGDLRAGLDEFANRLQLNYHIDGRTGFVVFRPADALRGSVSRL